MQNLIVLGLVPGTNIQITFHTWFIGTILLGVLVLLFALWRTRHVLHNLVLGFNAYLLSHRRLA